MANHILLVFEGARTESLIFNNLKKFYLKESSNTIVIGLYGSSIYSLYQRKKSDPDLDIFSLIKEKPENQNELLNVSRDDVSEIYLFFDYDGHDTQATDEKLVEMLSLFNEETEDGKLYLSYPMVESLKHLKTGVPFQDVIIESNTEYKKHVSENCDACFIDFTKLTQNDWKIILEEHCKKLNYLVMGDFMLPKNYVDQGTIFENQKEKYIDPSNKVAVLSSFPVFLMDYYGCSRLPKLIEATPE